MCYTELKQYRLGGKVLQPIVRIESVQIENVKNIRTGSFHTNTEFENIINADVLGFYGQNGSGKTGIVEVFSLLKVLLSGNQRKLPSITKHLTYFNENEINMNFNFIVKNNYGEFFLKYSASLLLGEEYLYINKEDLSYRENIKNKRFKVIISKNSQDIFIRNQSVKNLNEENRISVMVANKMSMENNTSFIFQKELIQFATKFLNEIESELLLNLHSDFNRDFHVIDAMNYGLLVANVVMPFSIHFENSRGEIPYKMQDTMVLPQNAFATIKTVIEQINIVLQNLIPGLQIKVNEINSQIMDDGSEGVRFEFLSKKGNIELPLRSESTGILKIISVLSTLIAVYNNPNACVVIDELDAGIFEYLLGELLEVISENGKGQLIFTSHNLRILEVLPIRNLWFTTSNEFNRFIQLKGVKKLSNARDIYLRAVQLGGQDESIYLETDQYDIKKSFRKAGILNGK